MIIFRILIAAISCFIAFSAKAEPQKRHALSLTSTPQLDPGFKHFPYVNPNAPKGGEARISVFAKYDNLNSAIFKGSPAPGLGLLGTSQIYDTLMVSSLDEANTMYCLLCEWVSHPDDFSSVTYKLHANARWHDGQPITPDDVIFSMETHKAKDEQTGLPYHPVTAQYYHNVTKVERTGENEVTFTFDTKGNRELPFIIGQLTIFPKHYWTGVNAEGKKRDISRATLEPPLGSGPYKIKSLQPGDTITFERVPSYWGRNLPVRIGSDNFDVLTYQYFGDRTVSLEAFKAGQYDFKSETSAKDWATGYDFPAVTDGRVVKRGDVVLRLPKAMQGFVFNLRRSKFQDVRVRKAMLLAYDFEWSNQNLFYGQYKRTSSYFEGQELASKGLPTAEELQILEPLRDKVPPEVFSTEYKNPVNANPNDFRTNLREAAKLLREAGWDIKDGLLSSPNGEKFTVEFLITNEQFTRVILPYIENLKRLGIGASVRQVDASEGKRREDNFDFDMMVDVFAQSESPGNEQRDFWSSTAADQPGSRNTIGIKNPAVDALIDKIIYAKNRDELVAATRALDRVLLWNFYLIPQWHSPTERFAYWNKFSAPQPLPLRSIGFPDVWWYDAALAEKNKLK